VDEYSLFIVIPLDSLDSLTLKIMV